VAIRNGIGLAQVLNQFNSDPSTTAARPLSERIMHDANTARIDFPEALALPTRQHREWTPSKRSIPLIALRRPLARPEMNRSLAPGCCAISTAAWVEPAIDHDPSLTRSRPIRSGTDSVRLVLCDDKAEDRVLPKLEHGNRSECSRPMTILLCPAWCLLCGKLPPVGRNGPGACGSHRPPV
jgi:hypothetical protein